MSGPGNFVDYTPEEMAEFCLDMIFAFSGGYVEKKAETIPTAISGETSSEKNYLH